MDHQSKELTDIIIDDVDISDFGNPFFEEDTGKLLLTLKIQKQCFYNRAKFIANAGFKTDGKSIPPWLQPVIGEPFQGDTLRAALFHDVGCQYQLESQKDTHKCFRRILKIDGVPFWKRHLCYLAVKYYNRFKNPNWK